LIPDGSPYPRCRGNTQKGREVLEKLRGTSEVDAEFADIVAAVEIARPITMRQVGGTVPLPRVVPRRTLQVSGLSGCQCMAALTAHVLWPGPLSCCDSLCLTLELLAWHAATLSFSCLQSWRSLFTRRYMPQLLTSFVIQFFQQFTGINAIIFCESCLWAYQYSWGVRSSAAWYQSLFAGIPQPVLLHRGSKDKPPTAMLTDRGARGLTPHTIPSFSFPICCLLTLQTCLSSSRRWGVPPLQPCSTPWWSAL